MSKFVLTAQLQLQAPTNTAQVVRQIQSQLQGVKVDLQLRNAQKAETEIRGLSDSLEKADKSASKLGGTLRASIRRFTALAIATRAVSLFTNTIGKAIESAIDFERELLKVSQVTGNTMTDLRGLTNEINRLSTSLGVSSQSILSVGRILSQAGLDARETQVALSALAKTELAPTFDDITQTAEGAVAIFNQFKQGANSLESQLGSLNAVAGQFAVESGDLISVIRRTGGVFKQAGGDLNELIALFTSVRSTTRESAESIATGLRTIFTRIQRPQTIKYLEQFGVKLTDLEGKFIGPYRAVGELNKALSGLEEGDITFVAIAEELGGFRQIGKVLPLIKEYAVAQQALKVAQEGSNSLAGDAAKAQASLAVRIVKVKEEFLALIRSISETRTFQLMANGALGLASALIKIADAVKPLIPLLGVLAGIKLAKGLAGAFGGFLGGGKPTGLNKGGRVHAFATGGIVPGTGNSDTVPAMLTPGEFVIKKSSVQKLGAENLAAMNNNKFKKGTTGRGVKKKRTSSIPEYGLDQTVGQLALNESKAAKAGIQESKFNTTLGKISKSGSNDAKKRIASGESPNTKVQVEGAVKSMMLGEESQESFGSDDWISQGLSLMDSKINEALSSMGVGKAKSPLVKDEKTRQSIEGYGLETFISGLSGKKSSGGVESFDFRGDFSKNKVASLTVEGIPPNYFDAKRSLVARSKIVEKGINDPGIKVVPNFASGGEVQRLATGGKAKEDFGKIGFRSSANEISATYIRDGNRSGRVTAVGYGPSLYTVSSSNATKGYGPKLYDVVMELATANGSMLTSDRSSVSADAQRVWEYYFKNRNDVTKQPLDPSLWTKNQSLIAPELYGDKETWPAKTHPAWVLQSGYKKPQRITTDPSRAINLNDPDNLEKIKASQASSIKSVQKKQFGGIIQKFQDGSTGTGVAPVRNRMGMTPEQVAAAEERKRLRQQAKTGTGGTLQLKSGIVGGLFLQEGSGGKSGIDKSLQGVELPGFAEGSKRLKASIYTGKLKSEAGQAIRNELKPNITQAVQNAATSSMAALEISPLDIDEKSAAKNAVSKVDLTSIEGYIFEAFTSALTGLQLSDAGATFDYVNPSQRAKERVGQLFSSGLSDEKLLDAKRTLNTESVQSGKSSIANKIIAGIKGGLLGPQDFQRFATGGSVGTDTVPALLTPGEFVINRKSAQSIGYGKLNRMNKVGKYAAGGVVQKFSSGTSGSGVVDNLTSMFSSLARSAYDLIRVFTGSSSSMGSESKSDSMGSESKSDFSSKSSTKPGSSKEQAELTANIARQSRQIAENTKKSEGLAKTEELLGSQYSSLLGSVSRIDAMHNKSEKDLELLNQSRKELEAILTKRRALLIQKAKLEKDNATLIQQRNKDIAAAKDLKQSRTAGLKGGTQSNFNEFDKKATSATKEDAESTKKMSEATKRTKQSMDVMIGKVVGITYALQQFRPTITDASSSLTTGFASIIDTAQSLAVQLTTLQGGLQQFGVQLNKKTFGELFSGEGSTNKRIGVSVGRGARSLAESLNFDPKTAKMFGKNVAGITTKLVPFAATLGVAVSSIGLFNSALETFYNYSQRLNKAIEEGDVEKAGEMGEGKYALESANTARVSGTVIGAAVGSIIPGIGTAIGAGIGALFGTFTSNISSMLGNDNAAKLLAESQAGLTNITKNLELNTKAANEEMQRFKEGNATISDALNKFASSIASVAAQQQRTRDYISKTENPEAFKANQAGTLRDIGAYFGGGLFGMETSSTYNARMEEQSKVKDETGKRSEEVLSAMQPVVNTFARQVAVAGGDFDTFKNNLSASNEAGKKYIEVATRTPEATERLRERFENIAREAEKTRKALEAMNLGFTSVNGTANATALSLNNYLNAQNAGYSGLSNSLATLEASMTSAAQGISSENFEASLGNASNVLRKFGGTEEQIKKFEDNVRGVNAAQKGLPDSFKRAREALQAEQKKGLTGQATGKSQSEAIIDSLVNDINSMNIGEDVKKSLTDQVKGIKFEEADLEKIAAGDFSVLEKKLSDIGNKQLEQVKAIQKENEIQQKINETIKKRLDLEDQFVKAQQRAVDIMMEMKEGISKFGGDQYTPEQRSADIVQSYNVQAEQAGITGLQEGSPLELRRTADEITRELDRISNVRLAAGGSETGVNGQRFTPEQQAAAKQEMEGESGVNLEKQQARLNGLLEKQYSTTKALIDQKIKELNLIKEKNQLEKSAMDDLIAGDMAAFFDKMAAQGAQAALATGDERLINLYGGQAIGQAAQENRRLQEAGVTELYGQKLAGSGGLTERGFQAVADRAGIADPTFAQAAAGTTVEEAAAEKEIRELYKTLEPLAQAMEKSAENDLKVGQQMEFAARELGGAAVVLQDAAVKLGGDTKSQQAQAGAGGSGTGGVPTAGQAAVNQANVNAQTAVINVNNAEVSGGGGGGGLISGTLSAAASNPAGTAQVVNQVVKRLPSVVKGVQPLAGKVVDDIVSKFAGGRASQRSISGGLPGAQKAQGLLGKAGGLFERLNQASLGDDFNPNTLQRGKNLFNAGKNAVGGLVGNARNAFNVGKQGYDLAGIGYDTTKLSKTAKVSNFVGRNVAAGQQKLQPLLSRGKQALDFTRNLATPAIERGKQVLDSTKTVAKPLLEKASPYLQITKDFGANALKTGREFIGRNAPKASSLADDAFKGISKFGPQVAKVFPTLAKGAGTVAKGFGKVLPGLGTIIDGAMEVGSFLSDPKAYHADKIEKTTRGFGDMLESWGLGSLQTGFSAIDGALATALGGLEGFLNPVGKVVEGAYNLVGGFQDAASLLDSSIKVGEQEKKASESMSETTRKRAEKAGYTGGTENYDKLSASEKSAAQAEANTLFRKGEAEKIAKSGGSAEDYRKAVGMDKETFANAYGEGANIQDVIKSEQKFAETQKEERRAKARENRTYSEYFTGADVEQRSDIAVQEKLAINQAEARKRREEEVTQKAATQESISPQVAVTQNVGKSIATENVDKGIQNLQQLERQSQKQEIRQYKQEESTSKQIKGAIPAASESVYKKEQAQQSNQMSVGIDPELLNKFSSALDKFNSDFSANIDRLENTKFKIELQPTNININLNGGNFLENLREGLKEELIKEIGDRMQNQGFNPDGSPKSTNGSQLR